MAGWDSDVGLRVNSMPVTLGLYLRDGRIKHSDECDNSLPFPFMSGRVYMDMVNLVHYPFFI